MSGRSREKFRGCSNVRYVRSGHFADLSQCPLMTQGGSRALKVAVMHNGVRSRDSLPLPKNPTDSSADSSGI